MAVVQQSGQPVPPSIGVYWYAVRAFSFPASIVSVLVGSALAFRGYFAPTGGFDPLIFVLTLVGSVLAHAGGNVLNDYFDFVKGVDTEANHGSGILTQGMLTPRQVLVFGSSLLVGAAVCGGLILLRSPNALQVVVPLALLGLVSAVLYTALLKKYALGDPIIIIAFGIGLTVGAYGVQVPLTSLSQWGWIILLALPISLLVDGILHANNMRDSENDAAKGYRTLANLTGRSGSHALFAFMLFAPPLFVVIGVLLHLLPWSCLAVLLALPLLAKANKSEMVPAVAQSHLIFGLLYALGIVTLPR